MRTGAPWEPIVGYSRAIRVGNHIRVSGTIAFDEGGGIAHPGDPAGQTRLIFERIEAALKELGASLSDVVRTRVYVIDIQRDWEAVGRVHGQFFGDVLPATSMVQVSALIDDDALVEIEVDALVE